MKKNNNKVRLLITVTISFCAGAYSFSTFQNPNLPSDKITESPVKRKTSLHYAPDPKKTLTIAYTSDGGYSFVINSRFPERESNIKSLAFGKTANNNHIKPKF